VQEGLTTSKKTVDALWRLQKIILDTPDFEVVVAHVVNAILTELGYLELGYRILVLTLVDPERRTLKRIALSETDEAKKALQASPIPFEHIEIPLSAADNLLIRTLEAQPHQEQTIPPPHCVHFSLLVFCTPQNTRQPHLASTSFLAQKLSCWLSSQSCSLFRKVV